MNRAIDEVESDSVPAVLLLCRNSTDTGASHMMFVGMPLGDLVLIAI